MNKRKIGSYYEKAAQAYLEDQGIHIIDRNVYCGKIGEIDLIGEDESCLIFFEIKYRKNGEFGSSLMAITNKKKEKIRKCAEYYLAFRKTGKYIRFDVCGFDGESFTWIKNAF